jgi:hypothetical protein
MIYFIRCGDFVKIGRAENPAERVKGLQTGNPYEVELLGVFDGNDSEERRLHAAFSPFHHKFEWFFLTKTIRSFVEQHCDKDQKKERAAKRIREEAYGTGEASETVKAWLNNSERAIHSPASVTYMPVVYEDYQADCLAHGETPVTGGRRFAEELRKLGLDVRERGNQKRFYVHGIKIARNQLRTDRTESTIGEAA